MRVSSSRTGGLRGDPQIYRSVRVDPTSALAAWAAANKMTLGAVLEASVLIEAGGGTGNISFPTANVTAQ